MALAFTLPDTSGSPVALHEDGARAAVVVFTCNHCPYALAWHERLQAVARDYADRGVRFLQINANNADKYPRDSVEASRARVEAGEFAGPYLVDESQEVARAWGAKVTNTSGVVFAPHARATSCDSSTRYGPANSPASTRAREASTESRGYLSALLALICRKRTPRSA